jgi:hypothetical protein
MFFYSFTILVKLNKQSKHPQPILINYLKSKHVLYVLYVIYLMIPIFGVKWWSLNLKNLLNLSRLLVNFVHLDEIKYMIVIHIYNVFSHLPEPSNI